MDDSRALVSRIDDVVRASHGAFLRRQDADGAWRYPLEGSSVLPDAYFVIAQRLFGLVTPEIEVELVERIATRQLRNGGWPLYPGQEGHASTTVEAYIALRMHGVSPASPALRQARSFLAANGGLSRLSSLTRITLALLGLRPWDEVPFMPVELVLLPRSSPIGLHSFVSFTRIHMVSILALGELRYRIPGAPAGLASELGALPTKRPEPSNGAGEIGRRLVLRLGRYAGWTRRLLWPAALRRRSLRVCQDYLVTHQEPDGSWGNYILSTLFGVLALRAMGSSSDSPVVRRGCDGLRSLLWRRGGETLTQPCNSTIWSTSLITYCLRETGLPAAHPALARSSRWLLRAQNGKGTWGFQEGNEMCPDVDDTVAAIRALLPVGHRIDGDCERRCLQGERWALAMQNDDGGWSSFDRNCRSRWLERIPFNDMRRAMTDPSTADMTGRMLEFLGVRGRHVGQAEVDAAVEWLRRDQDEGGSWFGRWGIAYLYGTWAALMGLAAVGVPPEDPMIRSAVRWLEERQNLDGGWGESCRSDTSGQYVALGRSTPSQSAWALMGLASSTRVMTRAIVRGVEFLCCGQESDGKWVEHYPTGAGFAGKLYLDYRFYKDVWPLQALGLVRRLLTHGAAWEGCPRLHP